MSADRNIKNISPIEQLKTTNMWTGSKEFDTHESWVYDEVELLFKKENLYYPEALKQIIDEIITNAADHYLFNPKTVSYISIEFDIDTGYITVQNNGPSLRVIKTKDYENKEHWLPEMAVAMLNSSSNYTDERIAGGANGAGMKLTNAYSDYFEILTYDTQNKLSYMQVFQCGLTKINEPVINILPDGVEDTVRIKFLPSFSMYKTTYTPELGKTIFKIIQYRAYQIAGITGISVFLNKTLINLGTYPMLGYAKLFNKHANISNVVLQAENGDYLDIYVLGYSIGVDAITIINGLNVRDGGNHVKYILNALTEEFTPKINKLIKNLKSMKIHNILTNAMTLIVRGQIRNPIFDSQIKVKLTNPITTFTRFQFTEKQFKNIWNTISDSINLVINDKLQDKKKTRINRGEIVLPKFQDARHAGKQSTALSCILWIVEGDSAEGTVRDGITSNKSLGFEKCGIFIIGGVPINARKYTKIKIDPKTGLNTLIREKSLEENERFQSLIKVIGLDFQKSYDPQTEQGREEMKTLRYGCIFIMTDQDDDGSQITGLIINMMLFFWPNLAKWNFIKRYITPIIRIKKDKKILHEFMSIHDYKNWLSTKTINNYDMKYYKGLGTHTDREVPLLFKDMSQRCLNITYDEEMQQNLETYYGKSSENRKTVLKTTHSEIDYKSMNISVSKILETVVKEFQRTRLIRNLPNTMDGFCESPRKIIWGALQYFNKKNGEVKVSGLANFISGTTHYLHGEDNLNNTIILMAQNFAGAKHLPLLLPLGNFGKRRKGGKDSASPRYIYTKLNYELVHTLFPIADQYLLDFVIDEGKRYEPKYFIPVLPLAVLENNSGIAVGWANKSWARDLNNVISNVKDMINGKQKKCKVLATSKHKFKGEIKFHNGKEYVIGTYKIIDAKTIQITELPTDIYPHSYLELDKPIPDSSDKKTKKPFWANDWFEKTPFDESSDEIKITLYFKEGMIQHIMNQISTIEILDPMIEWLGIYKILTSNLNYIGLDNEVSSYDNYYQIVDIWYEQRKELYAKRVAREYILTAYQIKKLEEMMRFINLEYTFNFTSKTTISVMYDILQKNNFPRIDESVLNDPKFISTEDLESNIFTDNNKDYSYLLSLTILDKSSDKCLKRQQKLEQYKLYYKQLEEYLHDPRFIGAQLWLNEIDQLEKIIKNGYANNWGLNDI